MSFVTMDDDGSQPLTADELAQLMNYYNSHGQAAENVTGEDIDFADQFLQQTEFLVNQGNNNNFNDFGQLVQNNPGTGNSDFFTPQFQNFSSQPQMIANNQVFQQPQNSIFMQQQYNNQQMFTPPQNPGFIMQSQQPIPVFGQTIKQESSPNSLSSSQDILQPPKKQQRVNSSPSTPIQNNIPQTPPQPQPIPNQQKTGPVVAESSQLLARLQNALTSQHDQISQMRQHQKQVLLSPQKESFEVLNNQQETLKKNLDAEIKALNDAIQNTILQPHEVRKAFHLHQELLIQSMQLELYHQELGQLLLQPGMPTRCYVALVITEQPFPAVIRQNKAMDDPVVATLLTGANVNLQTVSPVKILVNIDASQPKGTSNKFVENEVEPFDEMQKNSKFHCKFQVGSRKGIATVKFSANVQLSGGPMLTLESNLSNPFVIITNECQYEESDGILLKATAFGTQNDAVVAYPFFGNLLQRHFLRGTKQDPVKPQRFLSKSELAYLNQKFFNGRQVITAKMYDEFWAWFGKGLQKLRYQRHLLPMWQSGLIYGFISREGVNALLVNQEVGTFLIRFSERHPGTFAIGYVIDDSDPEKRVRHYLIRPEDVSPPKKLLPDFLMECPQFSRFLQVSYDLQTGTPKHRIIDKEIVLEPYGAKVPAPEQPVNGYDPSLVNASHKNNGGSPGLSNAAEYQLFTSD